MGFFRQEHWSRLLFPSPADLPDPAVEPRSPELKAGSLLFEAPWKPQTWKQPKYPTMAEWIKEMWCVCVCVCVYKMDYYLLYTWDARRSNQSILKEISPGYSFE